MDREVYNIKGIEITHSLEWVWQVQQGEVDGRREVVRETH